MKYAFVIGSSAFIVPHNTISYGDREHAKYFLRINSIYHDIPDNGTEPHLSINLDIKDTDGTSVVVTDNKLVTGSPFTILKERNSVKLTRLDGSPVIHVHQLDDESAMKLEHNITAELEINAPVVVIRVTGEFMVDHLHIRAENEKLLINDNGYATSALTGKSDLLFTSEGVVL